jgi:uncharacterized membrane protein (UPF0127 family)
MRSITVGSTTVSLDVADTEALREQGLSGRASLSPGHGMLFVFDKVGSWGIWMKDMLFSIDIIWLNKEGAVVGIKEHATPQSYPEVFYPVTPTAAYVLEVPAGFVQEHGLAQGSKINVQP